MRKKKSMAENRAMAENQAIAAAGGAGIFLLLLLIYGCGHRWEQSRAVMAGAESTVVAEDEEAGKKVALTFDDGPHPYYTEQLLDGLKEGGVHVTFFVTGDCVMLLPD